MICQIEINKNCNWKCWYCQNKQYKPPMNKVMSMKNFEEILERLSHSYTRNQLNTITFAAYNEPTLDPYFIDRLRSITQKGFSYYFISNGSKMNSTLLRFLTYEKPSIENYVFNIPSLNPINLSTLAGISMKSAKHSIESFIHFLRSLHKLSYKSIKVEVHGNGGKEHKENYLKVKETCKLYGVSNVELSDVVSRAGMLSNVGRKVNYKSDRFRCKKKYLNNFYIGVELNMYLCCHDYYQITTYANIRDGNVTELISDFRRGEALLLLAKKFCKHCEYAIPLDEEK
jgi:wyosine [tRNA(Phe)-imidazoG37] synthetase (radical SAM superfamily)